MNRRNRLSALSRLCVLCETALKKRPNPRVLYVGDVDRDVLDVVRERYPTVTIEVETVADLQRKAEDRERRGKQFENDCYWIDELAHLPELP